MAIPSFRPEWMDEAECCKEDNEDFFPPDNDYSNVEKARSICKRCPVWKDCLAFAVTTKQSFGVWAGSTPTQRRQLRSNYLRTKEISHEFRGSPARR
jgi:WhiB family redox-sensing transcriptional regulator